MDHDTLVLLFSGAIGSGAAIALFPQFCRSIARTARAKGLVTGNVIRDASTTPMEHGTPVGGNTIHAQVTFTVGGVERTFVSDTGFSWGRESPGRTVGVVYDPKDPTNAGLER